MHNLIIINIQRMVHECRNLSLGLVTEARGCKVMGQEGHPGVTSHALKSAKSAREWTSTLPNELSCWKLESQMESQIFRMQFQGSKIISLKSYLYHWKAFDEGYNFALDLITVGGLHKKLCPFKVARILVVGISGLPIGSPRTKSHLDVALVERRKI